tara:strand:- start:319 stop:966 length:648 start_codon:yes stop_codon:yes gene_type:complete
MNNIEILISNKFINYKESIQFMEKRVQDIFLGKKKELIWFLNHDHIITQGVNSSKEEIIKNTNLPIIKTNRGGKTTYHGPGQRIVYFLIDLNKRKKDIRKFISVIELSLIIFLKKYNITAQSFEDRVGIWVTEIKNKKLNKEEKIGAIGLRLKKWITYHGLSFNIDADLNHYHSIHACGLKNYKITSLNKLGIKISDKEFDKHYTKIFIEELNKL